MSSPSNNSANLQLATTSPTIIVNTENDGMRLNEHQLQIETQDRPTGVRRFRHFKNPPQPHMCIKDHTIDGQEIYINVMSWIRMLMPDQLSDPIPLYGGMRVPAPASNIRSAQFVYAVMANPNILKHVKRNCADAEEKHALVELMCDFVEAMNPGLKLKRQPEVLKDRDLTGELKDVWGAVQAKREREKDGTCNVNEPMSFENSTMYKQYYQLQQPEQPQQHHNKEADILMNITTKTNNNDTKSAINNLVNNFDSIISLNKNLNSNNIIDNVNKEPSLIPSSKFTAINNSVLDKNINISMNNSNESEEILQNQMTDNSNKVTLETVTVTPQTTTSIVIIPPSKIPITTSKLLLITPTTAVSTPTTSKIITSTIHSSPSSTKKEKLGGFLPNGCHNIFPFIKSKSSNNPDNKEKQEKIQQKDKRSNSLKKPNKNNCHITDKSISVTVTTVVTSLTTTSAAASSTACVETLTPTSSCTVSYSDNISNNKNNNSNSNNNNNNGNDYNNSNNNNNNKTNNNDIVNKLGNDMSKISLNKLVDSNLILKDETFIDKNCH